MRIGILLLLFLTFIVLQNLSFDEVNKMLRIKHDTITKNILDEWNTRENGYQDT